ncbi:MAG: hypothetical protein HQK78_18320 [Desulfobacterales bacterium]|nr:hypothetical protein [Desulfobacterales bacterium]
MILTTGHLADLLEQKGFLVCRDINLASKIGQKPMMDISQDEKPASRKGFKEIMLCQDSPGKSFGGYIAIT